MWDNCSCVNIGVKVTKIRTRDNKRSNWVRLLTSLGQVVRQGPHQQITAQGHSHMEGPTYVKSTVNNQHTNPSLCQAQ